MNPITNRCIDRCIEVSCRNIISPIVDDQNLLTALTPAIFQNSAIDTLNYITNSYAELRALADINHAPLKHLNRTAATRGYARLHQPTDEMLTRGNTMPGKDLDSNPWRRSIRTSAITRVQSRWVQSFAPASRRHIDESQRTLETC